MATCGIKLWSAQVLFRDPACVLRASTVVMEAEESENDRSSDGNSVLDLSYSSSLFEGSIGGEASDTTVNESTVVEPYLYEPECSDSPSPSPHNSSNHEGVNRLTSNEW